MNFTKKSFNLSSDTAQMLDDYVSKNLGMSLTLIVNSALKELKQKNGFTVDFSNYSNNSSVESTLKSVNIDSEYCDYFEKIISGLPGLSFTAIVNFAVFQWLKNPSFKTPEAVSPERIRELYLENAELMDELAK